MTTITTLIPDFSEYLKHERKLSDATTSAYLSDLRGLNKFVCNIPVTDINKANLRAWMRHLSKEGLTAITIRRKFHCYRTFWAWLRLCEIDNRLLPEQIPLPKRKRKAPIWMTDSQLTTFVNTLDGDPELDLAWMIFAVLGLRRGEVLALQWEDIDMEGQKITIQPGKGGRARILHYPNALQSRLLAVKPKKSGKVLTIGKTTLVKAFKAHIEACNLGGHGFTPHTLRHTFATHLISRGVDITIVKELLGHKDITHTMIYVHHQPEQYRDAINQHILSEEKSQ